MENRGDCIFCQMQAGLTPYHQIWEDSDHFAFLSIFPNTLGFTVVATKNHFSSYAFEQTDAILAGLILATKRVAQILDSYFEDVSRCGMFFEGYGVDHLHSKLFPMHGTGNGLDAWKIQETTFNTTYYEQYPGFLSSNNADRAEDAQLASLASAIRKSVSK
ncbi:MAG TPA: HIT family protein [Candidatus Woesebacteria bacterium]|nr:HIT family protein [Candidatus Woesebacteria bacterium]HNS64969.1 HIT family protein [Candidatus Woesebacteria bacterium]